MVRVCEKLQVSLTPFIGADGFRALLQRSLALARVDVPFLQAAAITAQGHLDGLEGLGADPETDIEAATAITAHLLGLLVTFIGEPLTFNLVYDSLSDAAGPTIAKNAEFE